MHDRSERELPYAWVVVGMAGLAVALSMGLRSTVGLLFHPWEEEFGWSRAALSITASLGFLAYGLAQPLAGWWADRYGPRRVFGVSLALLGTATAAVALVHELWQAYLVFGLALMAAVGGASNVPAAVAIARWVRRRKAFAVGLVMGGGAAGQFILVPVVASFIDAAGWRAAFAWTGIVVLAIAVPLVLILLRDDPPRGERFNHIDATDSEAEPPWAFLHTRNFWYLTGGFWICGTSIALSDVHLIPHAEDIDIDKVTAASAFGVLAGFNLLGTLAAGVISDRWGRKQVLGSVYALRALVLVALPLVHDPAGLFVFAVAFGMVDFASVPPTTALATTLFNRRSAGTVIGLVSLAHQLGSAAGSYAGGVIHGIAGSYIPYFLLTAFATGLAALLSWSITEPSAARPGVMSRA